MPKLNTSVLPLCFLFIFSTYIRLSAQKPEDKCGTDLLQQRIKSKSFTEGILAQQNNFTPILKKQGPLQQYRKESDVYILPVVFHIVMKNPQLVTTEQILAQLKRLNEDWSGRNADTLQILSQFKSVKGKSKIQFCLGYRDVNGNVSVGIERSTSNTYSIVQENDPIKHNSSGGADAWDPKKFINVWVVEKMEPINTLGYGSYPELLPENEDGIVITYTSLPGGKSPNDLGRTLTHEMGHFFYLLHPWVPFGCSGSDFPNTETLDDTPNQSGATYDCPAGTIQSGCTTNNIGKNYQVFMDYPDDACMHMFTNGHIQRAELILKSFRSSLIGANACVLPPTDNMQVFVTPNPVKSILFVQHLQQPVDLQGISIFNSVGQVVYRQQFFRTALTYMQINIAQLAPGLYSIRLDYENNKPVNRKFIKM
jgi:hypothetical protein